MKKLIALSELNGIVLLASFGVAALLASEPSIDEDLLVVIKTA